MEGAIALIIIGALAFLSQETGRAFGKFRIPSVVGYVILGIILGKSFLNILNPYFVDKLSLINDLALGVIAFIIGGELNLRRLRRLGKSILTIAIFESLGAFLFVILLTYIFTKNIYFSIILGAISSATAPAATVAVINQYRARGPLTTTILGVVGIDDAIALIIYTFASTVCLSSFLHIHSSLLQVSLHSVETILFSILGGALFGIVLGYLLKSLKTKEEIFGFVLAFILLGEGIAMHLHLSELLFVMSMAFVVNNLSLRKTNSAIESLNTLGFPLIATFFALAGTHLDIKLLPLIGGVGMVYFFARILGKTTGAYLGAKIFSAPRVVQKYVGFSLWPQIGVAIALAIMVKKDFGHLGEEGFQLAQLAVNILLFTTIFTEILGPLMTKFSLEKAGEIKVR
ncbi:MAG: hypothetical protein DRP76_03050 [Candidatus Omnitrophota bacterium]|nr:MAG: hypothetical protein DRP76_03050 [Candidatus Omnitrophota bacterium]